MIVEQELKLDYKDVLLRPKRSTLGSRSEVDLHRQFVFKSGQTWTGVPIVASNMDHTGTVKMACELHKYSMITCFHKYVTLDDIPPDIPVSNIALTAGLRAEDSVYLETILSHHPEIKFICLDVANGYSERFSAFVKTIRQTYPDKIIIAGNVVTGDMAVELVLNGADIIKVGIGPGSVCKSRVQTGVGYPQLSAIMEVSDAVNGVGGYCMADGGCCCPGDVAKSFSAGAHFQMLGGMLAGHDECSGKVVNGKKQFYGMSSDTAMTRYSGGVAEYRSSEGKTVEVEYKGPVENTIKDILGGLRSACTYIGARKLKHMPKCATFVRVTQQSNEVFGRNI